MFCIYGHTTSNAPGAVGAKKKKKKKKRRKRRRGEQDSNTFTSSCLNAVGSGTRSRLEPKREERETLSGRGHPTEPAVLGHPFGNLLI
ncbi:unnamed protein product [Pleuronectes platessa]|uniref:Uncharacterized protein n=1 Tax=Pleuronectes platessa TaxID=8262 RepID=A0A9N7ZBN4_PLEPL|nr:unnamed protein product [Pleuronectes platessa]